MTAGPKPDPRKRPGRRARAATAAALVAIIAAAVIPLPADAAAGQAINAPVQLRLTFQPDTVAADGQFPVIVAVDGAPAGSSLATDIYDRVSSADLETSTNGGPRDSFERVALPDGPGTQQSGFAISLYHRGMPRPPGAWSYRLDEPGVYPVRVRIRARGGRILASLVTYLVRLPAPGQQVAQRQVALLATVHQDPPSDRAERAHARTVDPELLRRIGPVLTAIENRPELAVSFAVTPDTIYRLSRDDDQQARDVMSALRKAVSAPSHELLDAPYVDIDPGALVDAGLTDELSRQRDLGRLTLTDLLTAPATGTWSVPRPVTGDAVASLRARGVFRLVLPRSSFSRQPPTAALSIPAGDGEVQALAVDPGYAVGASAGADPVLAGHRLLARMAAVGSNGVTTNPSIVATVGATPTDPTTLRIVLDGLALGSPFYQSATISQVLSQATPVTAPPLAPVSASSLGSYPDLTREVHASVASYASMLIDRPDLAARFDRPLAVSAAADLAVDERTLDLQGIEASVQSRFQAVTTTERDKVTLGARVGRFPLPIRSGLRYPVRVIVDLEANDRLSVSDKPIITTLTGPRTITQIRVRARASGDAPLRITVRSPDGRVVLAQSSYTVRSTAVSGVGVALTAGAALFLAQWWGRNWWRSRRRARHAE